jgi:hypothetical protein
MIFNNALQEIVMYNQAPFTAVITWTMSGIPNRGGTSAYYFAVALPYVDEIVAEHTKLTIARIGNAIRQEHPLLGNDWGIAFLITKPLQYLMGIPVIAPLAPLEGEEEEVDDKEEEEE